jgi:hypothetical protein
MNFSDFSDFAGFIDHKISKVNESTILGSQVYWDKNGCGEDYYDRLKNEIGAEWVKTGCTKVVLYFNEYPNVVFKIPIIGSCYVSVDEYYIYSLQNYNNDFDNFDFNEEKFLKFVEPYRNATCDGMYPVEENDYCAAEAYLYKVAKEENISELFAATYFLCNSYGVSVYVSEKMDTDKTVESIASKMSIKKAACLRNSTELSTCDIAAVIEQYDFNKAIKLIDFCAAYDIFDFNSGNIGFDDRGKFRIIDYSSFREDF